MAEWSRRSGRDLKRIWARLRAGYSPRDAVWAEEMTAAKASKLGLQRRWGTAPLTSRQEQALRFISSHDEVTPSALFDMFGPRWLALYVVRPLVKRGLVAEIRSEVFVATEAGKTRAGETTRPGAP